MKLTRISILTLLTLISVKAETFKIIYTGIIVVLYLGQLVQQRYYRPQTKLLEGNVFTPVCQSFCSHGGVHGEGAGASMVKTGTWQRRDVCGKGRCACQKGACVAKGEHVWQRGDMYGRGGCMAESMHGNGGLHVGGMATEVGSTHPTGTHYCSLEFWWRCSCF